MSSITDAERVQKIVRERFGRLSGVHGVGVTWDENGVARVRVNVESRMREVMRDLIPATLDGVLIELRSISEFKSFAKER
jgi:hypothetical protein